MFKKDTIRYALSGAAAGLVNGIFGAGGGMVLIPMLTKYAKIDDKLAFSTSIAIILPICLVSIAVYSANGSISLLVAAPYLVGGLVGGLAGGLLFRKVSAVFLHRVLGLFILWGGVRLIIW